MEKTLTVIVPAYNAEPFLEKCLKSFWLPEASDRDKIEVIIINDGSGDGTAQIAEQFVKKAPDMYRLVNKENAGHGSGINAGADLARGIYMKVVDADDWVRTGELGKFLKFLDTAVSDVVFSDYATFHIGTGAEKHYTSRMPEERQQYTLDALMEHWGDIQWGTTFHGICYRTAFYRSTGYRLTERVFYEDQEYATMPCSLAQTVALAPFEVYVYRVGDVNQSVSASNQVKRLNHFEQVILNMLRNKAAELPAGGERYWMKKTGMCLTSYYEIALLKNRDYKVGRRCVISLNRETRKLCPALYDAVRHKYLVFAVMNRFHVKSETYWKLLGKIRGRE